MAKELNGMHQDQVKKHYEMMVKGANGEVKIKAAHSEDLFVKEEYQQEFEQFTCLKVNGIKPDKQGRIRVQHGQGGKDLKCFTYHLSKKYEDHALVISEELGKGDCFDHLCGRAFCHRADHLIVNSQKANTDRIGCFGNMYTVGEQGDILQHYTCDHKPTCKKMLLKRFHPYAKKAQ